MNLIHALNSGMCWDRGTIRNLQKLCAALAFCLTIIVYGAQSALALAAPTFSPGPGLFFPGPSVTLSASSGASIYYTLDGSQPTTSSQLYSTPITVNASTTVNAMAELSGTSSTIVSAFFKVDSTIPPLTETALNAYAPVLWLRSDVGVSTDGSGNVQNWQDLSGNGNDASQSSSSNRPIFNANDWNGFPSVTTASTSSRYFNLPSGFTLPDSVVLYFVTKPTGSSNGILMDLGNGAVSDNITATSTGTTATFTIDNGSSPSSISSSSALTLGQYQLLGMFQDVVEDSAPAAIYTNGTLITSGTLNSPNGITRANNHIGTDYSGSANFYDGGFLEVLAYGYNSGTPGYLDTNEVEMYALSRYQLLNAVPPNPLISVSTSSLSGPTQVAIAVPPDSVCRYTTDGTTPDISSPVYTGPLNIFYSQTLQAINFKNGVASSVSSATYTLDSTQWPAPDPSDTTPLQINFQSPTN
jgi:hypothetical protein